MKLGARLILREYHRRHIKGTPKDTGCVRISLRHGFPCVTGLYSLSTTVTPPNTELTKTIGHINEMIIYDVGGSRTQRNQWMNYFEDGKQSVYPQTNESD